MEIFWLESPLLSHVHASLVPRLSKRCGLGTRLLEALDTPMQCGHVLG